MTFQEMQNNEIKVAIEEALFQLKKRDFDLESHTQIKTLEWVISLYK